jgi:hypothetical protein
MAPDSDTVDLARSALEPDAAAVEDAPVEPIGSPVPLRVRLRPVLRRVPLARPLYRLAVRLQARTVLWALRRVSFQTVPNPVAVRLAYEVLLRRDPEAQACEDLVARLDALTLNRDGMVDEIRASEEFHTAITFAADKLSFSIHDGRQQFVRSLPRGSRILDLGGAHRAKDEGALVALGYPYDFDELTIIDLPPDDRHELYYSQRRPDLVLTPRGPVTYRYQSMAELGDFADGSLDLVYAGQSIEHVAPDAGIHIAQEAFRILRPGGHFAIDTPNARVTRLQQAEFIDPDHEIEYDYAGLRNLLIDAGFTITFAKGLNYAGPPAQMGTFDIGVTAANAGFYDAIEDCYIICVVARR